MIAIHIYFTLFKELFLDLYSLTCAATMNKINLHLIENLDYYLFLKLGKFSCPFENLDSCKSSPSDF